MIWNHSRLVRSNCRGDDVNVDAGDDVVDDEDVDNVDGRVGAKLQPVVFFEWFLSLFRQKKNWQFRNFFTISFEPFHQIFPTVVVRSGQRTRWTRVRIADSHVTWVGAKAAGVELTELKKNVYFFKQRFLSFVLRRRDQLFKSKMAGKKSSQFCRNTWLWIFWRLLELFSN